MNDDETLYREVRQGSKAAFEHLYGKYERPVFAYVMRRLQNREEAEEVFHEAMLSIFRGPEAQFQEGAFAGWLFRVAHNLALNRLRKQKRERVALVALKVQLTPEDQQYSSSKEALSPEDWKQLEGSVDELSAPLRQVYDLRVAGKTYDEMAKIAGVPVGTIRSRVHKMMGQLRKEISQWLVK